MGIHTAAILAAAPRKAKKAHVFITSYAIIASLKALFIYFSHSAYVFSFLTLYLTKERMFIGLKSPEQSLSSINGVVGLALLRLKTNKQTKSYCSCTQRVAYLDLKACMMHCHMTININVPVIRHHDRKDIRNLGFVDVLLRTYHQFIWTGCEF